MPANASESAQGGYHRGQVSITIPTLNAASTVAGCLYSVRRQSYPHWEVIVVDGGSRDGTVEIARAHGAKVMEAKGGLLAARVEGILASQGEFVLLLDADQVLEPTALERGVHLMEGEGYDMLVLEELSLPARNFWQKLFSAHRRLIHRYIDSDSLDPLTGTVLPRLFRRSLLLEAIRAIPPEVRKRVIHHDHAIIYLEARKRTQRVGILPRAIYHREPDSLRQIWRRNFRYGRSLAALEGPNPYSALLQRRDGYVWPRRLQWRDIPLAVQSALLLTLLKAIQKSGLLWEKGLRAARKG